MTNYELGKAPVGLRAGRVMVAASLGGEPVTIHLRTADPAVSIKGLWTQHGAGYMGMFNRPSTELPKQVTLSVARADGRPFPAEPRLNVTATVGLDSVSWTVAGLGGMPVADVVTLSVDDDWLTFARPAGIEPPNDNLTGGAASMAAAARQVLKVASVPPTQRAHVVVAVDPSGSMKTRQVRSSLNEALEGMAGIHAVLGGEGKRLEWYLATSPPRRYDDPEALLAALEEAAYGLGSSLDLPSLAPSNGNELSVVYLISDDVPGSLAQFADVDMQARHLVVVANPATAPAAVGPVDVTVWPAGPLDDSRRPALAKDLLRGCFDANSACGRAVGA